MPKGIFCLEGNWFRNQFGQEDRTTVEPVLHLLEKRTSLSVPYLHHNVATKEEFEFRLKEWRDSPNEWSEEEYPWAYPILYLGFHGAENTLGLAGRDEVSLDEIEEFLEDACMNRVIFFASCLTLSVHGNRLNRFLKTTKAFAICGYGAEIDWLVSTIFDAVFLNLLQQFPFDQSGKNELDELLKSRATNERLNRRRELEGQLRELRGRGSKQKKQKKLKKRINEIDPTGDLETRLAFHKMIPLLDFRVKLNPDPDHLGE